jgi:hypothetical protein
MTYTFDIAYDCPISDFLQLLENYNLKLESFIAIGPGGGNPEITVSGSEESIEQIRENIFG